MPTRLKNLKATAQIISKGLGHDMRQFERAGSTAWVAFCKGCGRQMMVDPEDVAGYWGDATTQDCGPVQPKVPVVCQDVTQMFDQLNAEFDGSALEDQADTILANVDQLGLVEQLEIIELKCEPEPTKAVMVSAGPDGNMKMKPRGRLTRLADGTVYEMRSDGWRRVRS